MTTAVHDAVPAATAPGEVLVATSGLTKTYGSLRALDGASLRVQPGCTALLGENGAGKSTLIKLLLGLNAASGGSARVLGFDPATHGPAVRARVGYFPEHDCLPNDWQAQDFVRQMGEVRGLPPRIAVQRASDVLAQVGLAEERYRPIGGFSTGMKQRVKLAQALVHDPQLVLLDEPTNGLDPLGRDQMLELVQRVVHEMGINVLISSHLLADVQQVSDAVILLDRGHVAAQGGLRELLADTDTLLIELIEENPAFVARLRAAGLRVDGGGRDLRVPLTGEAVFDTVRDAAADSGAGLARLKRGARSLEEVFLSGTGNGARTAAP
ncbi:MAG TPA: ABC transporter ATP-binding protein [Dehalococcoidia bacterium]|nr:ABC transporter ATP-binding protein [Dehalococcoidia bacterium]